MSDRTPDGPVPRRPRSRSSGPRTATASSSGTSGSLGRHGEPIEAYLVEPAIVDARVARPRLVFAHWFDTEAPNGNRTQFVDEAVDWARRHSAAAILPQLTFPWARRPDRLDGGPRAGRRRGRPTPPLPRRRRWAGRRRCRRGSGSSGTTSAGCTRSLLGDGRPPAGCLRPDRGRCRAGPIGSCRSGRSRRTGSTTSRAMRPLDPIEHIGRAAPGEGVVPVRPARLLHRPDDRPRVQARRRGGRGAQGLRRAITTWPWPTRGRIGRRSSNVCW